METLHAAPIGARMQEMDEVPPPSPHLDYGELLLKELEELPSLPDLDLDTIDFTDAIFDLDLDGESHVDGAVAMAAASSLPEVLDKEQERSRKRTRGRRSQGCPERTRESPPKRRTQRGPGVVVKKTAKSRKAQENSPTTGIVGLDPAPAGVMALSSSPPRVFQFSSSLHPSIQLVSLSDNPGYLVPAVMGHSPPVLSLLLSSNTTPPTYILVPAPSQHSRPQVVPLSPDDGAVAPDLMGSSPPDSLSDCASKGLPAPPVSPVSPVSPSSPSPEVSPCKRRSSSLCSPATAMPECVKNYQQQAKAHMRESCQEMEAGLRLDSHYVDVRLVARQILIQANKCLDKELVIMGDAERKLGRLKRSQMFQNTEGTKPKRSIVLLGNAGMGKSTLIKKLCLDWSGGALPQFDFTFLLDGKALRLTEQTYSLQSLLLHLSPSAPRCRAPEAVFTQVLSAPERVLLVLDGFDKARDYETLLLLKAEDFGGKSRTQSYSVKQLYAGLLQRRLLAGCTLFLCVRDRAVGSQLLRRADSLLDICGFSPADIQAYLERYFTEPGLRASALERLRSHGYLLSLCWNPALCRAACLVLERSPGSEPLPSTCTGLWRRVVGLRLRTAEDEGARGGTGTLARARPASSSDALAHVDAPPRKHRTRNAHIRTRSQIQTFRGEEERGVEEENGKAEEGRKERKEEGELLSQLSSLAWEGLKSQSSLDQTISARLQGVGLRCGLFHSRSLKGRRDALTDEREREKKGGGGGEEQGIDTDDIADDSVLSWAHPFLQSFLGGANLALSRAVSDRSFLLQTLPSQPRGRRRTQGEMLDLAHRSAIGLLFHSEEELRDLGDVDAAVMDTVVSKQASVKTHLERLRYGDLNSAQLLEVCCCVHETGDDLLARNLARNLPAVLSFHKVPLCPADAFVVWSLLEKNRAQRRGFCLGLEDTGVWISGLRALVGLSNVATYRACLADTIALWQELEQAGEQGLLEEAVTKLSINPFRATQVCHIEHLSQLVHIHTERRLPGSQSESVLAEGIPAVRDLDKLEYELGPVNGPLALPTLLELLPALHNLKHLDLEKSKMGDWEAERLANVITSLSSLAILNLSQNCIGDQGVERLAAALCTRLSLHRLSLHSNVIGDAGAESLAAFLPRMTSLTDLDVKYNKFTDVGAQCLGSSLRDCPWIKSLGMWNECIPIRELERLQQQDSRIHSH